MNLEVGKTYLIVVAATNKDAGFNDIRYNAESENEIGIRLTGGEYDILITKDIYQSEKTNDSPND